MISSHLILIACGSFNPVTRVHLDMFRLARKIYLTSENERVFKAIISPVANDYSAKKKQLASSEDRIHMIELAIEQFNKENPDIESDFLHCDKWESKKQTWSPTIQVLNHFQQELDNGQSIYLQGLKQKPEKNVKVRLLCGADMLQSMTNKSVWKENDIREILTRYGMVVVNRNSIDLPSLIENCDVLKECKKHIHIVDNFPGSSDSSTKARAAIAKGEDASQLLYKNVCNYILSRGLYRDQ